MQKCLSRTVIVRLALAVYISFLPHKILSIIYYVKWKHGEKYYVAISVYFPNQVTYRYICSLTVQLIQIKHAHWPPSRSMHVQNMKLIHQSQGCLYNLN